MSNLPILATSMVALTLVLAACGGSSKSRGSRAASSASSTASSTPATTSAPPAAADPSGQLKFAKPSLSAKAGKVTIHFTNSSSLPHNLGWAPPASADEPNRARASAEAARRGRRDPLGVFD